jgi:hypothetical protein
VGWICALSSEKAASEACLDEFHGHPQYKHQLIKTATALVVLETITLSLAASHLE